jgi:hypothetical protein
MNLEFLVCILDHILGGRLLLSLGQLEFSVYFTIRRLAVDIGAIPLHQIWVRILVLHLFSLRNRRQLESNTLLFLLVDSIASHYKSFLIWSHALGILRLFVSFLIQRHRFSWKTSTFRLCKLLTL